MVPFLAEMVFQEPPPIVSSPTLLYWSPIQGLKTFPSVLPKMVNAEVISREENKNRFQDIVDYQTAKSELILFIDFFRDPQKYSNVVVKMPKGAILTGYWQKQQ